MLKFVKLEEKYKEQLNDMLEEWYSTGEKIVPYAIRKVDYRNYEEYLKNLDNKNPTEDWVPDSTFFLLRYRKNFCRSSKY